MIYGYCRISRKTQSIERQERNIKALYPDAVIYKEAYTGTKLEGRKVLDQLLRQLKAGDLVVFDSASRMSRNADEAMELYQNLFEAEVNLVFLKEPHINTDTYKASISRQIEVAANTGNKSTDNFLKAITDALNRYTMDLAKDQIALVFQQAQKEVEDLRQRTKEGIETARLAGKQIGQPKGKEYKVKKAETVKGLISRHSRDLNGTLSDVDVMKLAGVARNTYYKYKRELLEELAAK